MTTRDDEGSSSESSVDSYRFNHDWETDGSISTSVVRGVAAVTDESPEELEPLYETVDPDVLDELFSSLRGYGAVTFEYNGCTVTVNSNGVIELEPETTSADER
jgi:hypothetical protein